MDRFFRSLSLILLGGFWSVGLKAQPSLSAEELNAVFEIPLFQDSSLWDDEAAAVAGRLGWPKESVTSYSASFRLYAGSKTRVLGARPYSLALYANPSQPTMISMVFINKGDFVAEKGGEDWFKLSPRERKQREQKIAPLFASALQKTGQEMEQRLREALGEPRRDRFGGRGRLRERVWRWDWKDHAILLSVQEEEFIAVRVLPISLADAAGREEKVPDGELRAAFASRVIRRSQGDVLIGDLPMIYQGPKGFCVPATWERALRYAGVPADMYVLAMAGRTGLGGGTDPAMMAASVHHLSRSYGRRVESIDPTLTIRNLRKYLDDGIPIMWAMQVDEQLNEQLTQRARARAGTTDWSAYLESLAVHRAAAKQIQPTGGGHVCMIIGYNESTGELAISDSWGPAFAERWITLEEARALTSRDMRIVKW